MTSNDNFDNVAGGGLYLEAVTYENWRKNANVTPSINDLTSTIDKNYKGPYTITYNTPAFYNNVIFGQITSAKMYDQNGAEISSNLWKLVNANKQDIANKFGESIVYSYPMPNEVFYVWIDDSVNAEKVNLKFTFNNLQTTGELKRFKGTYHRYGYSWTVYCSSCESNPATLNGVQYKGYTITTESRRVGATVSAGSAESVVGIYGGCYQEAGLSQRYIRVRPGQTYIRYTFAKCQNKRSVTGSDYDKTQGQVDTSGTVECGKTWVIPDEPYKESQYLAMACGTRTGMDDTLSFEIEVKRDSADIALRKFITAVNGVEVSSRQPQIDASPLTSGGTTARYIHPKESISVIPGDEITYTIRVYNEGNLNGYAKIIADHLPSSLEFISPYENAINSTYGWVVAGTDANGITTVATSYTADKLLAK